MLQQTRSNNGDDDDDDGFVENYDKVIGMNVSSIAKNRDSSAAQNDKLVPVYLDPDAMAAVDHGDDDCCDILGGF